jgi:hypothetical protein
MKRRVFLGVLVAVLAIAGVFTPTASAAIATTDLTSLTATDLANALVGSGVSVSNVTFTGANVAGGTFTGGATPIGFDSGVILSSGDIKNVVGPNLQDSITTVNGTAGDSQLSALSGHATFDAAVLEFDFVPNASTIFFQYVFASDEYNEFVNTSFNDVFAFYVNGTNCAVVGSPAVPVSINTINGGNPFGTNASHPELYRNNDLDDGGGSIDTEMDGLTTVLTCEANVTANATNHIKLAIADASDSILDANVFLRAGSFSTTPPGGTGDQGCSHGFWKNHLSAWAGTAFAPNQTIASVFSGAGVLGSKTLQQALSFKGGSSLDGAKQILLRQAVAALLNAAHPDVSYPETTTQVIADVNAALASGARATILSLAQTLDQQNNLGCPL